MNGAAGMHALGAAAQDGGVAGLQAQRARIAGHVGPALVDDADDAERHAHARDVEAVGPGPLRDRGADRDRPARRSPRRRAPSPRCAPRRAPAGRASRPTGPWRAPRPCRARSRLTTPACAARSDGRDRRQRRVLRGRARERQHGGGRDGVAPERVHDGGDVGGESGRRRRSWDVRRQAGARSARISTRSSRWIISARPRKPSSASMSALRLPMMRAASRSL